MATKRKATVDDSKRMTRIPVGILAELITTLEQIAG